MRSVRGCFLRRKWFMLPFGRISLPVPLTLKRLRVLLCVFILGTKLSPLFAEESKAMVSYTEQCAQLPAASRVLSA